MTATYTESVSFALENGMRTQLRLQISWPASYVHKVAGSKSAQGSKIDTYIYGESTTTVSKSETTSITYYKK